MKSNNTLKRILENKYILTGILFYLVLFIFSIHQGLKIYPDTNGYVSMKIIRDPLYPLLIGGLKLIFTEYKIPLHIFQLLSSSIVFMILLLYVKNKLNLYYYEFLILLFYSSYYIYSTSNWALSEALAFPLFILLIYFLTRILYEQSLNDIYKYFFICFLLSITRGQFQILLPFNIVLIVFLIKIFKPSRRRIIQYFFLVFFTFALSNIVIRTYHYIYHGHFVSTPFTGIQLLTDAIYVSKPIDENIFKGEEKEIYNNIFKELESNNLILHSLEKNQNTLDETSINHHYFYSYNPIVHDVIKPYLLDYYSQLEINERWITIDRITKNMSKQLISANRKDFAKMYLLDIIFNAFKGNNLNLFIFFVSIIFLLFFSFFIKDEYNMLLYLVSLSLVLMVINILAVALLEPVIKRYTLYTDIFFYFTLFLILSVFIRDRKVLSGLNIK